MSKILITGAKSFIGQSIYPNLLKNHQVCAPYHKDLDVTNIGHLQPFLEDYRPDFIIHSAVSGCGKDTDTQQDFINNSNMYFNLWKCKDLYKHLIVFGSGAEYNRKHNIYNAEEGIFSHGCPEDLYGYFKYFQRLNYQEWNNVSLLRIFNCFGAKEKETRFIKTCINNCLNNKDIIIPEDKSFSFFYIKDLEIVINHIIQNPPDKYFELNCVYEKPMWLSETAQLIKGLTNSKSNIIIQAEGLDYNGCGDKLKELNLPFIGLKNGLIEYIEEIKNAPDKI